MPVRALRQGRRESPKTATTLGLDLLPARAVPGIFRSEACVIILIRELRAGKSRLRLTSALGAGYEMVRWRPNIAFLLTMDASDVAYWLICLSKFV